jgi:hypothetical protein
LMQAVAEWSGGRERFDDTTVVVLGVSAVPGDSLPPKVSSG